MGIWVVRRSHFKMGKDHKIVAIPGLVIAQIHADLASNGIRIYSMNEVPSLFIQKNLIHPDVAQKSTCVIAGMSGSRDSGMNYMFLAAARMDQVSGQLVTDLDPIVMVSDLYTNTARQSGIMKFHGDFEGRTEFLTADLSASLADLQSQVTGSVLDFGAAPKRFTEAMHFMAGQYHQKMN